MRVSRGNTRTHTHKKTHTHTHIQRRAGLSHCQEPLQILIQSSSSLLTPLFSSLSLSPSSMQIAISQCLCVLLTASLCLLCLSAFYTHTRTHPLSLQGLLHLSSTTILRSPSSFGIPHRSQLLSITDRPYTEAVQTLRLPVCHLRRSFLVTH